MQYVILSPVNSCTTTANIAVRPIHLMQRINYFINEQVVIALNYSCILVEMLTASLIEKLVIVLALMFYAA